LIFKLYTASQLSLFKIKYLNNDDDNSIIKGNDNLKDTVADLDELGKLLYGKIDSSIRTHLMKRGITIFNNIYTGFDTEFKNINEKFNLLLSAQLAVSSRIILKIPRFVDFNISKINAFTGEKYNLLIETKRVKTGLITESINKMININRLLKFKGYESSLEKLVKGLKLAKPIISNFCKDDFVYFAFNRSPINT